MLIAFPGTRISGSTTTLTVWVSGDEETLPEGLILRARGQEGAEEEAEEGEQKMDQEEEDIKAVPGWFLTGDLPVDCP